MYKSLDYHWTTSSESETSPSPDPKLLNLQPTLLAFVLLRTVYHFDSLLFESSWISSFTNQQEGFGYALAMSYCLAPFVNALPLKYAFDNGVELPAWQVACASVVFAFGYVLYRASNNQKAAFRRNPYSPGLASLETIPTTQGKKLLVSSFWGVVRHPNYLGNIIIYLTWVPFVLLTPALFAVLVNILVLTHRAVRDDARCKQKYGAAWDRYCNKVKCVLIPKIY